MVDELRPESVAIGVHVGRPGEASGLVVVARQPEGSRPEGVDRSYPVRWFARLYVAYAKRWETGALYDDVMAHVGDNANDERVQLANRKVVVCNFNGQAGLLLPMLRKHRPGQIVNLVVDDGRQVREAPDAVTVGKPDMLAALVNVVETDRLRVVPKVERDAALLAALDTISRRAPRPAKELAPGELPEAGEDVLALALQYAAWWLEVRAPWRDNTRSGPEATLSTYD